MTQISSKAVVCLSASDGFVGGAIRSVTESNVNHAFIAFYSEEHKSWQALQTDQRGLVQVPVKTLEHSHLECYSFPELDLMSALPKCGDLIGDSYDFIGIVGFLVKIGAWRIAGRRIVNPLHKKGELFCSEFAVTYLQRVTGMYDWMRVVNPAGVAPGGLSSTLGVPSLQEMLRFHYHVHKVECPW